MGSSRVGGPASQNGATDSEEPESGLKKIYKVNRDFLVTFDRADSICTASQKEFAMHLQSIPSSLISKMKHVMSHQPHVQCFLHCMMEP